MGISETGLGGFDVSDETSVNDIFRFIQLRPRRTLSEANAIPLFKGTALVKGLSAAKGVSKRADVANSALDASTIGSVADVPLGPDIEAALLGLRLQPTATTDDVLAQVPNLEATRSSREFRAQIEALSDALIAAFFATRGFPINLELLQDVYRVYHVPPAGHPGPPEPLGHFLARPLLAPSLPRPDESPKPAQPAGTPPDRSDRSALTEAIGELLRLDRREMLIQPDNGGSARRGSVPHTLTAAARKLVSTSAATVLKDRGVDLAETPLDVAVQTLFAEKLALPIKGLEWPHPVVVPEPGVTLPPPPGHALVRPAGVADLLVVKQQIKRYEAAEIAHVENVLIGEKKSRAHRQLDRSEETFLTETESTRTQETELETADRFELNRETSRTIKNDQKIGFGLSLSGKYGPTVEFSSTFAAEASTSQEETAKNSSRYAKDVVSRSLERITERVRELRTRTIIRETEETNLHELDNQTTQHVSGIYQFLDKVYEAQVFN